MSRRFSTNRFLYLVRPYKRQQCSLTCCLSVVLMRFLCFGVGCWSAALQNLSSKKGAGLHSEVDQPGIIQRARELSIPMKRANRIPDARLSAGHESVLVELPIPNPPHSRSPPLLFPTAYAFSPSNHPLFPCKEPRRRVMGGYLRIGGVVLFSWIYFAITALIARVVINLRAEPVAGFALLTLRTDWFIYRKLLDREVSQAWIIFLGGVVPCPSRKPRRAVIAPVAPM